MRTGLVQAAVAAGILGLAGCGGGEPEAAAASRPEAAVAAGTAAVPAALGVTTVSLPEGGAGAARHAADYVVAQGASPAVLHYLAEFDDEGVTEREIESPSGMRPYFLNGVLYSEAEPLVRLLAPGATLHVEAGQVTLRGKRTGIRVLIHGRAVYVPVKEFARHLGAYTHLSGDMGTVWPHERLCEYLQRADSAAPVFQGADAEGLFSACVNATGGHSPEH